MLAKKTRITLIVAAIVATIILIVGIVMFLYLKTDILFYTACILIRL